MSELTRRRALALCLLAAYAAFLAALGELLPPTPSAAIGLLLSFLFGVLATGFAGSETQ